MKAWRKMIKKTEIDIDMIDKEFGTEVAFIIDGPYRPKNTSPNRR